jgi:hypothetical protein
MTDAADTAAATAASETAQRGSAIEIWMFRFGRVRPVLSLGHKSLPCVRGQSPVGVGSTGGGSLYPATMERHYHGYNSTIVARRPLDLVTLFPLTFTRQHTSSYRLRMAAEKDETASLSFRVPAQLKADLQKLADADRRALSPYLVIKLEQIVAGEKAKGKRK